MTRRTTAVSRPFPYHVHEGDTVKMSFPVSLREVLAEIEKRTQRNG